MTDIGMQAAREVPGSYGWPIIGRIIDTADMFLFRGWKPYFLALQSKYGNVFRHSAFIRTVTVLDPVGFEPLINWDDRLRKEYGFGWVFPPPALVGRTQPSIFVGGNEHSGPKQLYIRLLRARAATLRPVMSRVAADYFSQWEQRRNFSWSAEIERFYATFFYLWFLGTSPDPEYVRTLYNGLLVDPFWRITQFLPWSNYSRSRRIYPRLVQIVKGAPAYPEVAGFARDAGIADENEAVHQLLFCMGVNCYLGLQNLTKSLIGEISRDPNLLAALRAEALTVVAGNAAFDVAAVDRLPLLGRVVHETLRLHPPVFFIFGRATRDFELATRAARYRIKSGEMLMGVIPVAQRLPDLYPRPDEFQPDRFADARAIDPLVWSHGTAASPITAQNRICPGRDIAPIIAKLFIVMLLASHRWTLADPNVRWDDRSIGLNMAAPVGDLKVTEFLRQP